MKLESLPTREDYELDFQRSETAMGLGPEYDEITEKDWLYERRTIAINNLAKAIEYYIEKFQK